MDMMEKEVEGMYGLPGGGSIEEILRFSFINCGCFFPSCLLKYVYSIDYLENAKVVFKKSSI